MSNYHNLLSKCDRALVAYIVAQKAGSLQDTVPAKWSLDRALPLTVCYSDRAVEAAPYSGTYVVTAAIMVRSPMAVELQAEDADALLASDARVQRTFNAFHTNIDSAGDKLADAITSAARKLASENSRYADLGDFTALDVSIKSIEGSVEEGTTVWVDTLNLEVVCCPSNISDQ